VWRKRACLQVVATEEGEKAESYGKKDHAYRGEKSEWPIGDKCTQDDLHGAQRIAWDTRSHARCAVFSCPAYVYRHFDNRQILECQIQKRLLSVREPAKHIEAEEGFLGEAAESTGDVMEALTRKP